MLRFASDAGYKLLTVHTTCRTGAWVSFGYAIRCDCIHPAGANAPKERDVCTRAAGQRRLNPTAKLFHTEQVRAVLRDAGIPAEHWTRPHIFLTMLNHMKRRMEEDGTLPKARKPDSTDEAHLQPDAATSRADSKHGFEDFDLAPREEQLAIDVRPSLKHNEKIKEGGG